MFAPTAIKCLKLFSSMQVEYFTKRNQNKSFEIIKITFSKYTVSQLCKLIKCQSMFLILMERCDHGLILLFISRHY